MTPREQEWAKPNRFHALRQIFADRQTYASILAVCMSELYDLEWLQWHPDTVRSELWDDLEVAVPDVNLDKIQAVVALLTTDSFYQNLPRFIQLCNVFCGDEFDPSVFDPATAEEMAWAITEAMLLDPPDDPDNAFSDDIRYYIGAVVRDRGLVNPPDVLRLALHDRQQNADPVAEFADDPEMYSAFWQNQKSASDEIRQMLANNVGQLFAQLEALPLAKGNAKDLVDKMRKEIRSKQ